MEINKQGDQNIEIDYWPVFYANFASTFGYWRFPWLKDWLENFIKCSAYSKLFTHSLKHERSLNSKLLEMEITDQRYPSYNDRTLKFKRDGDA